MKHCPKCGRDKPESSFSSRGKDKLASYCKECQSKYCKEHYTRNKHKHNERRYALTKKTRMEHRDKIMRAKDNKPCADCGVRYPFYVMEFDHLDEKIANISDMPGRFGWNKIQKEIDKCDLVCSNCHRKRTFIRRMASLERRG